MIGRYKVPPVLLCQFLRVLFRFLEVTAKFDEIGALCPHRGVFFCTVAVGDHDVRRHFKPASRQCDGLTVIAAGRGDQPG